MQSSSSSLPSGQHLHVRARSEQTPSVPSRQHMTQPLPEQSLGHWALAPVDGDALPAQRREPGPWEYPGAPGVGRVPVRQALVVRADPFGRHSTITALRAAGVPRISAVPDAAGAVESGALLTSGDLAIVDLDVDGSNLTLVRDLRRHGWRRVTAVVSAPDPVTVTAALAVGVTGIVVSGRRRSDHASHPAQLTDREIDVVRVVADGRTNKQIGEQLGLSSLTVKSHLARIGRKFGTGERSHIVMLALRSGLID